jgi:ribosomal-protein-alanine N-acetyltransferase
MTSVTGSFMVGGDSTPMIETERMVIRVLDPSQAELMVSFRRENRHFLTDWEPVRSEEFFTEAFWQLQLRMALRHFRDQSHLSFTLLNNAQTEVLGVCNYSNIIRGTFQSCHLGYAIGEKHQSHGFMGEAITHTLNFVFDELRLHRVMANYMPRNKKSGKLLTRMGFNIEGQAEKYLLINGTWEDHILTSKINPQAI